MSHQNIVGHCSKCDDLFRRYEGFHPGLRDWFDLIRTKFFDAHISCAGRGKIDQEAAFYRHASNAHWAQSAHNWNAAIDLFQLKDGGYSLETLWFAEIMEGLPPTLEWYGTPDSPYRELPHVQIKDWRELAASGRLRLVEI